jgi:hypothetical protein
MTLSYGVWLSSKPDARATEPDAAFLAARLAMAQILVLNILSILFNIASFPW